MSSTFHVLFAPGLARADAAAAEARAVLALQEIGLIGALEERKADRLGLVTSRYPLAATADALFDKATPDAFGLGEHFESMVGNYANGWSLNSVSTFRCPACQTQIAEGRQEAMFGRLMESMQTAVVHFLEAGERVDVPCPSCTVASSASAWEADVPAGFAHLAFEFLEAPPFNSKVTSVPEWAFGYGLWRVDIPLILQEAVGNPIGWSMGRI